MKRRTKALTAVAVFVAVLVAVFIALDKRLGGKREAAGAARAAWEQSEFVEVMTALRSGDNLAAANAEFAKKVAHARERTDAFTALFRMAAFTNKDAEWNALVDWVSRPESEWPEGIAERLDTYVARIAPVLEKIREVAAGGGPVRVVDVTQRSTDMQAYRDLRHFARLLRGDAIDATRRGDLDRVVDDLVATMELGNALAAEPMLISHQSRMSLYNFVHSGVEFVPVGGLSEEQYARLQLAFAQTCSRDEFAESFASVANDCAAFFAAPTTNLRLLPNADPTVPENVVRWIYARPVGGSLRDFDETSFVTTLAEMQELARRPYYEVHDEMQAIGDRGARLAWMRPVTEQIVTTFANIWMSQTRQETMAGLAQVGLAVERYRDVHGAWPASLEEVEALVPRAILPVDPFTGSPFVYRVRGDSFRLYSVGPNNIDDLGHTGATWSDMDIVWRGQRGD